MIEENKLYHSMLCDHYLYNIIVIKVKKHVSLWYFSTILAHIVLNTYFCIDFFILFLSFFNSFFFLSILIYNPLYITIQNNWTIEQKKESVQSVFISLNVRNNLLHCPHTDASTESIYRTFFILLFTQRIHEFSYCVV